MALALAVLIPLPWPPCLPCLTTTPRPFLTSSAQPTTRPVSDLLSSLPLPQIPNSSQHLRLVFSPIPSPLPLLLPPFDNRRETTASQGGVKAFGRQPAKTSEITEHPLSIDTPCAFRPLQHAAPFEGPATHAFRLSPPIVKLPVSRWPHTQCQTTPLLPGPRSSPTSLFPDDTVTISRRRPPCRSDSTHAPS